MTLTILLDLDDTLLKNSTDVFVPAFLKGFSEHLSQYSDAPENIIPVLMASTQTMMQNNDPSKSLKEVFDAEFYPSLGWDYDDLLPKIQDFYQKTYPKLIDLTTPLQASRSVVQKMIERGYQISIATHPIYPQDAIQRRLDWAGLTEEKRAFNLVTSYENMHFAKPNPAYYTEILSLIGWPEIPIVMVGDDKTADIDPTREIGLASYWITENDDYTQVRDEIFPGKGSLDGLLAWIDGLSPELLSPDFSSPTASLAIQRSTPAAIDSLLKGLDPASWLVSPENDEWSLTEICCHLRDVDREIYIPRIHEVTNSERPFLEAIDADAWARERNYRQQDGKQALKDFVSARIALLELIDAMPQDVWEKEIRHTIFGPISLAEILRISARHDKLHIQQIHKILPRATG